MIIRTPADLGAAIRAGRRALGLGQADLAARVGVRRQWVLKIEAGKSTAELGLVLRTLNVLGLKVEVGEPVEKTGAITPPAGISYDIDAALERTRPDRALGSMGRLSQSAWVRARKDQTSARTRAAKKQKQ